MATTWKHRRSVIYAFLTGMVLLPLLLFWNAGWIWSLTVSLSLAAVVAWSRHKHPTFWYAVGDDPDPKHTARQMSARAHSARPGSGRY